MFVRW